tara:strand:+ start:2001 stop:3176 length:1176 start_codon:yes stop_codon:yes gene_type:complete
MKKIFKIFPVSFFLILFLFSEHIHSKEIYVVCDEPKGQRIDYETRGKNWKNIDDGFSNSFPTFVYKSDNPEVLNTHWPAGNPSNLDPDEIEKIVSGQATEKILTINDDLIESIQTGGTNTWITRLYPKKGIGVFLRHGYYLDESLYFGAVYKSNCDFKTLDNEISINNSDNEDSDIEIINIDNYALIQTDVQKGNKDGNFACRLQNSMLIKSENQERKAAFLDFFFVLDSTGETNSDNKLPIYMVSLTASFGELNSLDSFDIKSGMITMEVNDGFFSFEEYTKEPVNEKLTSSELYRYSHFLPFDKKLKKNAVPFGQAMNILLQISSGADAYLNFYTPDPNVENRNLSPEEEIEVYRVKLEFEEDKKEEVLACLSDAYLQGFIFLMDINNN